MTSGRLAELAGGEAGLAELGLIVGGDVTVVQERVAIVSTHLPAVQTDESTVMTSSVTAMVERHDAKGSGWSTATRLDHFTDEAGVEAAQNAIDAIDGVRVPSGQYAVVLGRQPVADLLNNLIVPACMAPNFYASNTPFLGRLGSAWRRACSASTTTAPRPGSWARRASRARGCRPDARTSSATACSSAACRAGTRRSACCAIRRAPTSSAPPPTRRSRARSCHATASASARAAGVSSHEPGLAASNVVLEGADRSRATSCCAASATGSTSAASGTRIRSTGLRAGDFTCTVVGDSYVIRGGRIAEPLRANTLRINDNIATILNNVVGVTKDVRGTVVWAEVAYTAEDRRLRGPHRRHRRLHGGDRT